MKFLAWIRKAITGALTTGGAVLVRSLSDGQVSAEEWALILGSAIIGGVAVFLIPNRPSPD